MGLLDELFAAGNTPWAQAMQGQMMGGPQPQPLAELGGRMGLGVAPPPRQPQPTQRPEMEPTARTAQEPSPRMAQPDLGGSSGIGGAEILGALLQGAGGIAGPLGRLISQSGERERADNQKNDTFKYFVKNGVPEETAAMAIRNPELGKQLLSKFLGPKKAPTLVDVVDEFGNPTKGVFNETTGKVDPISSIMATPASAAPALAQGGNSQPVAMDAAQPAPQGPAAILEAPGAAAPNLGTDGGGGMLGGLSSAAAKLPSDALAQPQPQAQPQAAALSPGSIVGPPSKNVAEGYVHVAAPDGRGYLYDATTKRPVTQSKAEAEARAKAKGEADASRIGESRVAEQFAGGLSQLKRLPDEFGPRAFERALGPWQATSPETEGVGSAVAAAVNWLPQQAARASAEFGSWAEGGAAPTEVRDRVETVTKNLAAVMKPLIRKPGEGAWSDKDQANLEAQIGLLSRSRNVEEYNRRVDDIKENVSKVFLVDVPEPKVQERSPNAPKTAEEEVTNVDKLIRAINPGSWGYDGPIEGYLRGVPAKKGGN